MGTPSSGGAPPPGAGAKSATHNELPTELPTELPRAAPPAPAPPSDASPVGTSPPADPVRARTDTAGMQPQDAIGSPPAVPAAPAGPSDIEDPTRMPGPREIPDGNPDDPAPTPGRVPAGDSRSFRKPGARLEFALVYRVDTFVISRFGTVGTRGQWRVVEYPTSASASHSYAKECSRFVADGFSDYRE